MFMLFMLFMLGLKLANTARLRARCYFFAKNEGRTLAGLKCSW